MNVLSIQLIVEFRCPECEARQSENFLAFEEIKCLHCGEIMPWADILTNDEYHALDAVAQELESIEETP